MNNIVCSFPKNNKPIKIIRPNVLQTEYVRFGRIWQYSARFGKKISPIYTISDEMLLLIAKIETRGETRGRYYRVRK